MNAATAVLVPLFAAVVLVAVVALSRFIRTWREAETQPAVAEDPEMLALEDEKQRLLATLKDLDHEAALGKLSAADHDGLKRHFERETLKVLDRLEELRQKRAHPEEPR
jgi:hypothetical protein